MGVNLHPRLPIRKSGRWDGIFEHPYFGCPSWRGIVWLLLVDGDLNITQDTVVVQESHGDRVGVPKL
jgi:hypothetical protein